MVNSKDKFKPQNAYEENAYGQTHGPMQPIEVEEEPRTDDSHLYNNSPQNNSQS